MTPADFASTNISFNLCSQMLNATSDGALESHARTSDNDGSRCVPTA